jgi:hypothetical protein
VGVAGGGAQPAGARSSGPLGCQALVLRGLQLRQQLLPLLLLLLAPPALLLLEAQPLCGGRAWCVWSVGLEAIGLCFAAGATRWRLQGSHPPSSASRASSSARRRSSSISSLLFFLGGILALCAR